MLYASVRVCESVCASVWVWVCLWVLMMRVQIGQFLLYPLIKQHSFGY